MPRGQRTTAGKAPPPHQRQIVTTARNAPLLPPGNIPFNNDNIIAEYTIYQSKSTPGKPVIPFLYHSASTDHDDPTTFSDYYNASAVLEMHGMALSFARNLAHPIFLEHYYRENDIRWQAFFIQKKEMALTFKAPVIGVIFYDNYETENGAFALRFVAWHPGAARHVKDTQLTDINNYLDPQNIFNERLTLRSFLKPFTTSPIPTSIQQQLDNFKRGGEDTLYNKIEFYRLNPNQWESSERHVFDTPPLSQFNFRFYTGKDDDREGDRAHTVPKNLARLYAKYLKEEDSSVAISMDESWIWKCDLYFILSPENMRCVGVICVEKARHVQSQPKLPLVKAFYLHPNFRERGIATQVINYFLQHYRTFGIDKPNPPMQKCLQKNNTLRLTLPTPPANCWVVSNPA